MIGQTFKIEGREVRVIARGPNEKWVAEDVKNFGSPYPVSDADLIAAGAADTAAPPSEQAILQAQDAAANAGINQTYGRAQTTERQRAAAARPYVPPPGSPEAKFREGEGDDDHADG